MTSPTYERITVADQGDGIVLITLNRPERRNAIDARMAEEIQQAFAAFEADPTARVAILTGAGDDAFSGGADVLDIPELWRCVPTVGIVTEKPIITAVGGWCVGGALVMAMLGDLVVAAENARFSYPEAQLGFTGGMIAELAARIPHHAAMELMLVGRPMDAQRAYQLGFVNEVAPKGQQVEAALAMARILARSAPLVLRTLKRFVNEEVMHSGPSVRSARVARDLAIVRESADTREGMTAFREKRQPQYTGR